MYMAMFLFLQQQKTPKESQQIIKETNTRSYFADFFMNARHILTTIRGVIGSAQVEGAAGSGGVCVIPHHATAPGGTTQAFPIFKVGLWRTLMGKEFAGRVDRLDKIIMGSAVTAR